jgi:hypothetical protein
MNNTSRNTNRNTSRNTSIENQSEQELHVSQENITTFINLRDRINRIPEISLDSTTYNETYIKDLIRDIDHIFSIANGLGINAIAVIPPSVRPSNFVQNTIMLRNQLFTTYIDYPPPLPVENPEVSPDITDQYNRVYTDVNNFITRNAYTQAQYDVLLTKINNLFRLATEHRQTSDLDQRIVMNGKSYNFQIIINILMKYLIDFKFLTPPTATFSDTELENLTDRIDSFLSRLGRITSADLNDNQISSINSYKTRVRQYITLVEIEPERLATEWIDERGNSPTVLSILHDYLRKLNVWSTDSTIRELEGVSRQNSNSNSEEESQDKTWAFMIKKPPKTKGHSNGTDKHPNYLFVKDQLKLKRPNIALGYNLGFIILHGNISNTYDITFNPENFPKTRGATIKIPAPVIPQTVYKEFLQYLQVSGNRIKMPFFVVDDSSASERAINAGGVSRDMFEIIGKYIKDTLMFSNVSNSTCIKNNKNNNDPAKMGAGAGVGAVGAAEASANVYSNKNNKKSKVMFGDNVPYNFITDNDIKHELSEILGYFAFVCTRLNEDHNFSLGINFSAFSLMMLFNYFEVRTAYKLSSIIQRIKKMNQTYSAYTLVPIDDETMMPKSYDLATRTKEFIQLDEELQTYIGILYAIDELYNAEDVEKALHQDLIQYPHEELLSLLVKYLYKNSDDYTSLITLDTDGNTIWEPILDDVIKRLERLETLSDSFLKSYTFFHGIESYNLFVEEDNKQQPIETNKKISLFSLASCITSFREITYDNLIGDKGIIVFIKQTSNTVMFNATEKAIRSFLEKNKDDQTILTKFIKYITGSSTLPHKCEIHITNTDQPYLFSAHTCFFYLDASIGTMDEEEYHKIIAKDIGATGFTARGGNRNSFKTRQMKQSRQIKKSRQMKYTIHKKQTKKNKKSKKH